MTTPQRVIEHPSQLGKKIPFQRLKRMFSYSGCSNTAWTLCCAKFQAGVIGDFIWQQGVTSPESKASVSSMPGCTAQSKSNASSLTVRMLLLVTFLKWIVRLSMS